MNKMIDRVELLKTLNIVKAAVAVKDYIPILTHFMFDGRAVTAYNDIQAIRVLYPMEFKGCIPADMLLKALMSIKSESISMKEDGNCILLSSGRTKISLPVLPIEDFPQVLNVVGKNLIGKFSITADMLIGLEKCLLSVGNDIGHQAHMGVTLEPHHSETEGALYSTDNVTISRYVFDTDMELDNAVILPVFFCQQLISILKGSTSAVSVNVQSGSLVAQFDNVTLFTKTLADTTPSNFADTIRRFIPSEIFRMSNIPDELGGSFDRAILVQEKEPFKRTRVVVQDKTLTITSNAKISEAVDSMTFDSADIDFSIDPSLVKRVLPQATKVGLLPKVLVLSDSGKKYLHLIAHCSI